MPNCPATATTLNACASRTNFRSEPFPSPSCRRFPPADRNAGLYSEVPRMRKLSTGRLRRVSGECPVWLGYVYGHCPLLEGVRIALEMTPSQIKGAARFNDIQRQAARRRMPTAASPFPRFPKGPKHEKDAFCPFK